MQEHTIQRLGREYLSFSLCERCGSSPLPRRALVYFQWYGFQASNHIIKALHHIYSSSKVSDNLQLFSTPTAKPCTNMNTLGSIFIIWCILFFGLILTCGKTHSCCILTVLINRWMKVLFLYFHTVHNEAVSHDKNRIFNSSSTFSRRDLFHLKASHSTSWKWFQRKMKTLSLMYNSSIPEYTIIVLIIKTL